MPQVAGHLLIAEKTATAIGNPAFIEENREYFNLGAVGPDLALFLFDPAGSSSILNTAVETLRSIRQVKATWQEIIDKATGPAEDFADWVTGGLYTDVVSLITGGWKAAVHALAMTVLPGTSVEVDNPFYGQGIPGVPSSATITVESADLSMLWRNFGHPYTDDPGYKNPLPTGHYADWWWVDLLHYRNTGRFAEALRSFATDDRMKAYAHGYITHIAGDVAGHPYVNAVVGGPFRNHVPRHMVMENIIDTWLWNHYAHGDVVNSQLHEQVQVGTGFKDVAKLLIKAMEQVYMSPGDPQQRFAPSRFSNGVPSEESLTRAYNTLMMYLEYSTDSQVSPPDPPPSNASEFFAEISDSLETTANAVGDQFNGDNEWWEWLLAPFLALGYALVLLFKIVTLPAAILVRVATLYPRWLAYLLNLTLYDFVRNARWQLALTGWGKPSSLDLPRSFAQLAVRIPGDRAGTSTFNYPYGMVPRTEQAFWLIDPRSAASLEGPISTECCPYPKASTPNVFIDDDPFDTRHESHLKNLCAAPSPAETMTLCQHTFSGSQLGNAVMLGKMMMEGDYPLTDLDLDGDRGYGFRAWDNPASPAYDPVQTD